MLLMNLRPRGVSRLVKP